MFLNVCQWFVFNCFLIVCWTVLLALFRICYWFVDLFTVFVVFLMIFQSCVLIDFLLVLKKVSIAFIRFWWFIKALLTVLNCFYLFSKVFGGVVMVRFKVFFMLCYLFSQIVLRFCKGFCCFFCQVCVALLRFFMAFVGYYCFY